MCPLRKNNQDKLLWLIKELIVWIFLTGVMVTVVISAVLHNNFEWIFWLGIVLLCIDTLMSYFTFYQYKWVLKTIE